MDWSLLLLLAFPLMMVFCMKGMFSGNKKEEKSANLDMQASTDGQGSNEIQALQAKMTELMEQNEVLMSEVKAMKEDKTSKRLSLVKKDAEKVEKISL